MEEKGKIILYPSNWLYNAGVVGFLRVLECKENVRDFLRDDGRVEIPESIFYKEKVNDKLDIPRCLKCLIEHTIQDERQNGNLAKWKSERIENLQKEYNSKKKKSKIYEELENLQLPFFPEFYRAHGKLFGSKTPFQNLVQREEWTSLKYVQLISKIPSIIINGAGTQLCDLCGQYKVFYNPNSKLELRLSKLQDTHLRKLGPSIGESPNSFWNNFYTSYICPLCSYLILHHREAFINLSDNSQIFINAPSFKLMWYLNNYARKIYEKSKTVKEIFGISLIELASKMYVQLGRWEKMNIEVVVKYNDVIEFFSLPYEIVDLLSNREIASLLNQIGEFKVLNYLLDGRFDKILEFGERIMKIALKPENDRSKNEKNFINENVKLQKNKNKNNLMTFSQNLFKLYALINDKIRGGINYEY